MKGYKILKFESVQKWLNSLDQMAIQRGKDGLTKNAKAMRLGRMWEYTDEGKLNPDELLEEAQEDIDKAGKRQILDTLINEETLLFAEYLRKQNEIWIPRKVLV